jgi:hypothetical protein
MNHSAQVILAISIAEPFVSRRGVGRGMIEIVYHIQSANRIDRIDWAVDGFLLRARVSAIRANGTRPGPSAGEMDVPWSG